MCPTMSLLTGKSLSLNMTLYELNKLYLEQDSEQKALTRIDLPKSDIEKRLIKYKKEKKLFNPITTAPITNKPHNPFEEYKKRVRELTDSQDLSALKDIEKRSFKEFHIDHKVSILHGFLSNIPAEEIADIKNLRILPAKENIDKRAKSLIDPDNAHLDSKLRAGLPRV